MAQPERLAVSEALRRYQVMAFIVGVGLVVLVFVGMPLQLGAGHPGLVSVLGPVHGLAYIVYLVAALDLGRRAHLGVGPMAAMVLAGLVPLLAVLVERRITERVGAQLGV